MSNQSNDAGRAWWSSRSTILRGGAIAMASIVLLAIMFTVFVGLEIAERDDPVECSTNPHLEGFYITAEDQKLREELSYRWINRSEGVSDDDCKNRTGDMCLTSVHYNGCCESKPQFVVVGHVTALNGTQYNLAPGQVYPKEKCTQLPHCGMNCRCTLVDNMFRGYTDNKHTKWVLFLLPSCCKCMN
ncbi:uncharacterized protein LOC110461623 [Mizuhopecten yessoensis]|uniref:uncharacterized protein LOC110461623 n=1 Tax=Mizuhopecten yessoensis TaxID=6573 RepID=UPI000B459972|nr:uncharacterized protein LOC110461623 [Mizuhopecten yessoensis]